MCVGSADRWGHSLRSRHEKFRLQTDTVISTIVTSLGGVPQTPFEVTYNEKIKTGDSSQKSEKRGYPPVTITRLMDLRTTDEQTEELGVFSKDGGANLILP